MKKVVALLFSAIAVLVFTAAPLPVLAADCSDVVNCIDQGNQKAAGSNSNKSVQDLLKTITNVLLFLIGAVSVIMIVIGGFRYVTSRGDATQTTAAKNTILYAVIGVVVAAAGYAIVNFVITNLK